MSHAVASRRSGVGRRRIWAFLSDGLLAFLFLAGCADGAVPESVVLAADGSSPSATPSTSSTSTTGRQLGDAGIGVFDAELDQMIETRTFDSMTDIAQFLHDCLGLHGIATEVTYDGGIVYAPYPAEQTPHIQAVEDYCTDTLGRVLEPRLNDPDPERLRRIFERNERIAECLKQEGIAVEPLPSFDAWAENRGIWNPFTYLPDDAAASLPDLYEACPELLDLGL